MAAAATNEMRPLQIAQGSRKRDAAVGDGLARSKKDAAAAN